MLVSRSVTVVFHCRGLDICWTGSDYLTWPMVWYTWICLVGDVLMFLWIVAWYIKLNDQQNTRYPLNMLSMWNASFWDFHVEFLPHSRQFFTCEVNTQRHPGAYLLLTCHLGKERHPGDIWQHFLVWYAKSIQMSWYWYPLDVSHVQLFNPSRIEHNIILYIYIFIYT